MVKTYKILTGKFDVDHNIWFTPLVHREGAASTRTTSGYLNLARREAKQEIRRHQFSMRVVPQVSSLPDQVKNQETLNSFKNAFDNILQT